MSTSIGSAQTRRAIASLNAVGYAVGPPLDPDDWRRQVRVEARRIGIHIRTGVSEVTGTAVPWAITKQRFESMRASMGGVDVQVLGDVMVRDAESEQ